MITYKGQMQEFTTRAAADVEVRVEKLRREVMAQSCKGEIRRLWKFGILALIPLYAALIFIIFARY